MAKKKADESFADSEESLLINMDEVQAQTFEALPKGTYQATIESAEYKLSASAGKPMWNIALVVTDGEYANRKIFTILSFSEGALPGTKAAIKNIDASLLSASFDPKGIAESGALVGKAVRVKTKIEPYNGEDQTRVASWLPASSDAFAG
jgi:hypothetical protein